MKKKLSFVLALAMAASVMGGCKGANTAQSASDPSLAAKEEMCIRDRCLLLSM